MSVNAIFNDKGLPVMGYGKNAVYNITGTPNVKKASKPVDTTLNDDITVDKYKVAVWHTANDFPTRADEIIGKTGVLNTGLKFTRNFTLGQGVFPCRVTGFDENGNETLEIIKDAKLRNAIGNSVVRRYLEKCARDYFKFGPAFVELIMSVDGDTVAGINVINARYCRYTEDMKHCIVSGKWPETPGMDKDYEVIPVLDEYDPLQDLKNRKLKKQVAGRKFIYPVKDSWSNNDYYPRPVWWSAYLSGWVNIANKVPAFLDKAYENQITWMWHVKIPYAYWEKRFPEENYKNTEERKKLIEDEMQLIEDNLTGTENANKVIFSMFEINPHSGKAEEQWEIEPLDNKYKEGDKLITSAAANSEIMFALMINPNTMGAGMPGGTYAGNQGGSNIREGYLINVANAWLDRQNILDPLECVLRYNGYTDIELRFRSTILTTLDTGAGTKEVQS